MSLRARLTAFVAVTVGLSVVVVAFAGYRSARDESISEIDRFLVARAGLVGLVESLDLGQGRGPGPRSGPGRVVGEDVVAQLVTEDGVVLPLGTGEVNLPVERVDLGVAGGAPEKLRTVTADGVEFRMLTRRVGPGIALQVGRDLAESEAVLTGIRNRLILVGLAGAALAALAGWWLAGRALRPVTALTVTAEAVAATGSLSNPIDVGGDDEIGRLGSAFNEMLRRLESSRSAQQRLVADASHELRTPLTSLRTNIELLARGDVPKDDRDSMVADLQLEISELGALVAELVDLATVGRDDEPRIEFDLGEVVEEAAARARRRAPGVTFRIAAAPRVVSGRHGGVARAVSNLIDNAVKWAPSDGTIEVILDESALTVMDDGPGFDEADLPRVFERFYRAATARSMAGSGLGLSIVAAVAEDHGWSPFARNRAEGGAAVGFRFGA
jgi:two-component system sensor histidine kinase MprB